MTTMIISISFKSISLKSTLGMESHLMEMALTLLHLEHKHALIRMEISTKLSNIWRNKKEVYIVLFENHRQILSYIILSLESCLKLSKHVYTQYANRLTIMLLVAYFGEYKIMQKY